MSEPTRESTAEDHEVYDLTIPPMTKEPAKWTILRCLRCCIPKQLRRLNQFPEAEERYRQRKKINSTHQRNRRERQSVTDRYELVLVNALADRRNVSQVCFTTADGNSPSSFLGRLPLELRNYIYEYVLGGRKILRLVMTPKGIIRPTIRQSSASQYAEANQGGLVHPQLLRTCRQIYNEALGIMYASNVFAVKEGYFPFFAADLYVLPQRMNSMRHLQVQWFFDLDLYHTRRGDESYNGHSWRLFWHLVTEEMKSLETLDMRFVYRAQFDWAEELLIDVPWIKPLRKVKRLEDVKIEIQWGAKSHPLAPQWQIDKLVDDLKEILTAKR